MTSDWSSSRSDHDPRYCLDDFKAETHCLRWQTRTRVRPLFPEAEKSVRIATVSFTRRNMVLGLIISVSVKEVRVFFTVFSVEVLLPVKFSYTQTHKVNELFIEGPGRVRTMFRLRYPLSRTPAVTTTGRYSRISVLLQEGVSTTSLRV